MENNFELFDEIDYGDGNFEFVENKSIKELLKSAHRAISLCELWSWIRIYKPSKDRGFMWTQTPELDRINEQMWKDPINNNHSGSSYGFIMREMECIAKNGYTNYKNNYKNNF